MTRYRYEDVEVEAIQWTGSTPQATEIINMIHAHDGSASFRCGGQCCDNELSILIYNPHDSFKIVPRDFIIKNPETGEFFFCDPENFHKSYTETPEGHL